LDFHFKPLTERDANAIAGWHYNGIYSFYDMDQDPEDLAELLDPASWDRYYRVSDENDNLIGFFSYEQEGETVEIGLGLRPDLTGRGLGLAFVQAGLDFGLEMFHPVFFCLSVVSFNQRAIQVYERAGFRQVETYMQETNGGAYEFVRMVRKTVVGFGLVGE
jgi:ribosomal-protein-alanine N-acetyltransferase